MLVNYIDYVYTVIEKEFDKEIADMWPWVRSHDIPQPRPKDFSNINQELYDMAIEVNKIAKDLKKTYLLKVWLYEIEGYPMNEVKG